MLGLQDNVIYIIVYSYEVIFNMKKRYLLNYTLPELKELILELGLQRFVADQLFQWIHKKFVFDFNDMSNLSKKSREILEKNFIVQPMKEVKCFHSAEENASKTIFSLSDNLSVESVILREKNYYTLCVSSQVGCPVDCKFCLTGVAGFKRNLEVSEIVFQILSANQKGYPISNLVFMGMGEPLLNYKNVLKAIGLLTSEEGCDISKRKVTVSTAGYMAGIQKLINDEVYLNLAFSVGSTHPLKRIKFMPIEKRNPIVDVSRLLHSYLKLHNRKLTLEYTLLQGVNDSKSDIDGLANLALFLNAKINLINLNPHEKINFDPISSTKLNWFKDQLRQKGARVTVRYRKGQDITAACGQLGESLL